MATRGGVLALRVLVCGEEDDSWVPRRARHLAPSRRAVGAPGRVAGLELVGVPRVGVWGWDSRIFETEESKSL